MTFHGAPLFNYCSMMYVLTNCFLGTYPSGCLIDATCEQTYDANWNPSLPMPFDWNLIQTCARAKTESCTCPDGYVMPVQSGAGPVCVKYPSKDICVKPCTCNGQDMQVN